MAADLAVTRRRRMLAFVAEQGGAVSLADANAFSEGKLLAAHQAFSAIMEGIVDGGFATWDGSQFTLTEAGHAEAALALRARGRRAGAGTSPDAPRPEAAPSEAPAPTGGPSPSVTPLPSPVPAPPSVEAPKPPKPPEERPAPQVDPPRRGVRGRLLGFVRRLLARGR